MSVLPRRRSSAEDRNRPSRVRVAVRVKPVKPETPLCLEEDPPALYFGHEGINKDFAFDHVFPGTATQEDVYAGSMRPFLAQFLNGFNVTVLAYGQTGAGKTYTVGHRASMSPCPSPDQPRSADKPASSFAGPDDGLIPRFLIDLFDALRNEPSVKKIHVSFLEIYCDEIHDLLSSARGGVGGHHGRASMGGGMGLSAIKERPLIIRDAEHRVVVENLTQVQVETAAKALELMNIGRSRQATGSNALNDQSSRSHAIYTVEVSRKFRADIKNAKLTFVDLAGSERLQKTNVQGMCMTESIQINVGLLALGNVINVLGEGRQKRRRSIDSSGANGDTVSFVPYRASKLTRLLRDALGGNSMSLFIACVSPATSNSSETLCTLRYADRARGIQNKAQQNVEALCPSEAGSPVNPAVSPRRTLARTASEIEITRLQEQIMMLKHQLDMATAASVEAVARATTPKKPSSPSTRAPPSKLVQPSFTSRMPKSSGSPEFAPGSRSKSQGQVQSAKPAVLLRSKSQNAAETEENTKLALVAKRPSLLARPRIHSIDKTGKLELPTNTANTTSAPAPAPPKRQSSKSTVTFKLFAEKTKLSEGNEPQKEEQVIMACHADNVEVISSLESTPLKSTVEPDPIFISSKASVVEIPHCVGETSSSKDDLEQKSRTSSDCSDESDSQSISPSDTNTTHKLNSSPTLLRQPSAVGEFVRRQSPPSRLQTPRAGAGVKIENFALKSFLATVNAPIPKPPASPTPSVSSPEPVAPLPERQIPVRNNKLKSFLFNVAGSGNALLASTFNESIKETTVVANKAETNVPVEQSFASASPLRKAPQDERDSFVVISSAATELEQTPVIDPSPELRPHTDRNKKSIEIEASPSISNDAQVQSRSASENEMAQQGSETKSRLQTPVPVKWDILNASQPALESTAGSHSASDSHPRGPIFPEEPLDWEFVDIPKPTSDQSTQCDEIMGIPELPPSRKRVDNQPRDFAVDLRGTIREHYKQCRGTLPRQRRGDRIRPIDLLRLDQEVKGSNQDDTTTKEVLQACQLEQLLGDMRELVLGASGGTCNDDHGNQSHDEPPTLTGITESMAKLLETHSQAQKRVDVLKRQVRHLARLTGAFPTEKHDSSAFPLAGVNSFKAIAALTDDQLDGFTLRYQDSMLRSALAEGEALVVECVRARVQNFEQAMETTDDNRPPLDIFLARDQYAACRSALDLGRNQLLPLVLTGWISVARAHLDAEISWLAL